MTSTWIALLDEDPHHGGQAVQATATDGAELVLVAWSANEPPHPCARRVDPRALGRGGEPMTVSWVDLSPHQRPIFDAPEVLEVRRALLRHWPPYGAATLVVDDVHLAGSVLLYPSDVAGIDDPFTRFGDAIVLRCAGFFVPLPAPTGPALERYAGTPWPNDRFP